MDKKHSSKYLDSHTFWVNYPFKKKVSLSTLTRLMVPYTVVRRVFKIDKVIFGRPLKHPVGTSEAGSILVHHHLNGIVVLFAEIVTGLPEVCHG